MAEVKIAILGDFNPVYSTHHALNAGIRQCNNFLKTDVQVDWISTDIFDTKVVFSKGLYSGLWIAPGSPYKDFENVLSTIEYARINNIPTLGNCGGFQHMIIEFARNVCGILSADHEETNSEASDKVIYKLSCSLVGLEEKLRITDKESLIYKIIGHEYFAERYYCSYGLNESYKEILSSYGLSFTSISEEGNVRSFELKSHPFFLGTLFQPALVSTTEDPNPVLIEFFRQCLRQPEMIS
jgi:CTP synthase (UTP-ammonia lyase)